MAIATTAEYKVWAGISGSTYDSVIAVVIAGVQSEMETYCGREFDYNADTQDLYDGTGSDTLVIRNAPITSNNTTIKLVDALGNVLMTYPASSYKIDLNTGVTRLVSSVTTWQYRDNDTAAPVYVGTGDHPCFPDGHRNILVTYQGGYGDAQSGSSYRMPDSLKLALYKLVDMQMAMRGKDLSLASENLGQYSYTRAAGAGGNLGDYQKMLASLMAPWRRLGVIA